MYIENSSFPQDFKLWDGGYVFLSLTIKLLYCSPVKVQKMAKI